MKLDLFIKVLDGERKVQRSTKLEIGRVRILNTSVDSNASSDPAYSVKITSQDLTDTQKRAQVVKERNARWSSSNNKGYQEKIDNDLSLTATLEKPATDFDKFFETISKNTKLLPQAHGDIDRATVEKMLAKDVA